MKTKRIMITIPENMHRKFKARAAMEGISLGQKIVMLIERDEETAAVAEQKVSLVSGKRI